jgi:glycosyltransferase involved in cell wall biosynthesis
MPTRQPLKVALVHSFYSSDQPSGENTQVESEHAALRRAGVDARIFSASTTDLEARPLYSTRAAARVATGRGRSPTRGLRAFAPDIVHVHNLFPNFGRAWVGGLDVPLVVTLHNYRSVCASATLFRDGHVCTDCPDGRRWSGLRHRCYRGSFLATAPLSIAQRRGPAADPVLARADRVLCLSLRQQAILVRAGVDADRLLPWTNFLPEVLQPPRPLARRRGSAPSMLYVGRLTPEKGCLEMVRAWPTELPLRIVGDGVQAEEVRQEAEHRRIEIDARLPRAAVLQMMLQSDALMVPSACPEGLPLVFLEALACGLPVVVRRDCDLAERVRGAKLGAVVDRVEDMPTAALRLVQSDRDQCAERCRWEYVTNFTERSWVERTIGLYQLLRDARTSRGGPAATADRVVRSE